MTREERYYSAKEIFAKLNPFKKKSRFSPELQAKAKAHLNNHREAKLNTFNKDKKAITSTKWQGNSHAKTMAGIRANYHSKTGKFATH